MSKGFIKSTEKTWTDENGQIQSSTVEKEFVYKTLEDEFYMIFVNFVKWMYGIKSISAIKLLLKLLEIAQFNTGEVSISSGLRADLISELEISSSMFSKAINELLVNNALFPKIKSITKNGEKINKIIKNEYIINPEMFWKGELRKRKDLRIIFQSKEEDIDSHNNMETFEISKEF